MRSRRGRAPWARALAVVLAGAGLLVGGCTGDGGEGRVRAETASPKPPVELNDELAIAHVVRERAMPCRKNELKHRNRCYRISDGFTTRRVKDIKALMPDEKVGRLHAAVRVDFESPETALLAEMTEKAHKAYLADPLTLEAKIAIVYGKDEIMTVAMIDNGPLAGGSMEVGFGIVSDQEIRDLVARMTA